MTAFEELVVTELSKMLWKEGRGEPVDGITAIGHTVIERVSRPSWWSWPHHDVLSVIYFPEQYTSMTHLHDKQLFKFPDAADSSYSQCRYIAEQILAGVTSHPAPGASHYFNPKVVPAPMWTHAATSKFIKTIGNHDFWYVFS